MSDIYTMPGHLIRRLQQISASVFSENMKAAGVDLTSPQFAALSTIEQHPSVDQATLAGIIAFDRATIGGVVDRLVCKKLVGRKTNPMDRRSKTLSITKQGKSELDRLRPVVEKIQDEILPGLDEKEKSVFIRLATKVAVAGNSRARVSVSSSD